MSDLSTRPPHAVPVAEMRAELAAEERHRLDVYPRLIAKGRLSREQMQRHLELWRAIRRDLALPFRSRLEDLGDDAGQPIGGVDAAPPALTWEEKIRELRAELAIRRNLYPRRIAQHGADPRDLAEKMEAIEAVHFDYWLRHRHVDAGWTDGTAAFRDWYRPIDDARDRWLAAAHAAREPAVRDWPYAAAIAAYVARYPADPRLPDAAPSPPVAASPTAVTA